MDLNAVNLFVTSARAGSLSAAARQTGVPIPPLSRRIRSLEAELGTRLFERGPRGLVLTHVGTQLLGDVAPALALLAEAKQRLRDASGIAGLLRLSIPPHFEPIWSLFGIFRQRYPAVRFDIFVTDRRVDLVADGVDVAIRVGEKGAKSYEGRVVSSYRHQVVAAPELLERHPITSPEDLLSVPCACWRTAGPSVWSLGCTEVRLKPTAVTNDYAHLLAIALSSEAVTEVPPFLAHDAVQHGLLVPILPDHPFPACDVRALVVEERAMTSLVRQFLSFIEDRLPGVLTGAPPQDGCHPSAPILPS